jgi:DNA excision repair protein ERCC-5
LSRLTIQREAYKYPTTDESEEPFHWGFPKLSALRTFLHEELSWSISKVDDELTPIVQRIARRGKVGSLNKQATLDPFFDLSAGQGNYAPRRRTTANVSKRLLGVIKAFREAEARVVGGFDPDWELMMQDLDKEDPKGKGTGKRKKSESFKDSRAEGEGDLVNGEINEGGEGKQEKPKPTRKPRKKKSASEIPGEEGEGDASRAAGGKGKGRARRDTASSVSISENGAIAAEPEILIPKNGLRGSATGVVGSGKRKKAALTAWRNSTQSKDRAPG